MVNKLVSIIVPVYNSEIFIEDLIETVKKQTYKNWELILVNDYSTDGSKNIIEKYVNEKIILINLEKNSGAAIARNKGIEYANGKYIAFLDSDDLWEENKLEKQIKFMEDNNYSFTFTSYQFVDENKNKMNKIVKVPKQIGYEQLLKNTTISTITVLIDTNKINKEKIYMPNIRRGQDTATWLQILRTGEIAYGLDEVLSYYRRSQSTLSSNKITVFKKMWNIYVNIEKLPVFKACYYFVFYAFNAIRRRV